MSITPRTRNVDNLWYPILVKDENGKTQIVEMLGKEVNDWNDRNAYFRVFWFGTI